MSPGTLQERLSSDLSDRMTIEREIARGGMAVVYLARDRKHDRRVAVKLLDPALWLHTLAERFHREIGLLARLQHAHILPLIDSGEAAGSLYYVMPYVEGMSLRQRLDREGALPVRDALRIAIEVADALAYAHGEGVVHRDIKPENVLLAGYRDAAHSGETGWHAVVCDFGIAHLTGRLTLTGDRTTEHTTFSPSVIGTPAYMSPEQAAGIRDVDGRTDVYALGIVLHELLTGTRPTAEPLVLSPRRMTPRRLTPRSGPQPRQSLPSLDVAREIERVVTRARSVSPDDRFATAAEMRDALQTCLDRIGAESLGRRPGRRAAIIAAAIVAVAALPFASSRVRERARAWLGGTHGDPSLVAVLPFASRGTPAESLGGDDAERLVFDAMSRWRDVRLADEITVNDALQRRGVTAPQSLTQALAVARSVGAGKAVWGELVARGDSTIVRAALYDASSGAAQQTVAVRVAADDAPRRFLAIADTLLLGRAAGPLLGIGGTDVLAAQRAYRRGHAQLRRWALDSARAAFDESVAADPKFAAAQLWLAQTLAWQTVDDSRRAALRDALRGAATSADAQASALPPRDRVHANALRALADERWADACARYESLVQSDASDFRAWYGLGECRSRDGTVVPDVASRTGWRFRVSRQRAIDAYVRALDLAPSFLLAFRGAAYARLARIMWTETDRLLAGVDSTGTRRFVARIALAHDTLAPLPVPIERLARDPKALEEPTAGDAAARGRERLLALAAAWATAMPRSSDALETYALALEAGRQLDGPTGALAMTRRARAAAPRASTTKLNVSEVRLLVKLGRLEDARARADSVLRAAPSVPAPEEAQWLVGLAALTGRTAQFATLRRAHDPIAASSIALQGAVPPPSILDALAAFDAYAAHGAPRDSVVATASRTQRSLASWAGRDPERRRIAASVSYLPLMLATPVLGRRAFWEPPGPAATIRQLQWAHITGDTTLATRADSVLQMLESRALETSLPIEVLLAHARVLVEQRREADASALLATTLDALPALDPAEFCCQAFGAAVIAPTMALRARLAAQRNERDVARRWAAGVVSLWANADPALQPLVKEMRAVLGR